MLSDSRANVLRAAPVLPPLSFENLQKENLPQAVSVRSKRFARDFASSPNYDFTLSPPPTPSLSPDRSSTETSPSILAPSTLDSATSDLTTSIHIKPPNAVAFKGSAPGGLSQRRRFKGSDLDLKAKESTRLSAFTPRNPLFSASSTPRTSILERVSSFISRSQQQILSPSIQKPHTSVDNLDPFGLIGESFLSEEKSGRASALGDVFDISAYVELESVCASRDEMAERLSSSSMYWLPADGEIQIYEACNPDIDPTTQKVLRRNSLHLREQRRERREMLIKSMKPFTSPTAARLYKLNRARQREEYLSQLAAQRSTSGLRSLLLPQKMGITVVVKEQTQHIDKLIGLIDEVEGSEYDSSSVYSTSPEPGDVYALGI